MGIHRGWCAWRRRRSHTGGGGFHDAPGGLSRGSAGRLPRFPPDARLHRRASPLCAIRDNRSVWQAVTGLAAALYLPGRGGFPRCRSRPAYRSAFPSGTFPKRDDGLRRLRLDSSAVGRGFVRRGFPIRHVSYYGEGTDEPPGAAGSLRIGRGERASGPFAPSALAREGSPSLRRHAPFRPQLFSADAAALCRIAPGLPYDLSADASL